MKKTLLSLAAMLVAGSFAFAGNGTQESPYTCAEAIAMNPVKDVVSATGWVEGYIVGNYNNKAFFGTEYSTSQAANILISDVENPTDKSQCVCVQLINGSDVRAALNLPDNPTVIGKKCMVYGDVTLYNTLPGIKNTSGYSLDGNTVGGGQGGETPNPADKIFSAVFTSGMCDFTIENVSLPEGLTYVWAQDKSYGMKASAYANGASNPSEAWLISPVFDLAGASEVGVEFDQALNKFASVESFKTMLGVYVREEGGQWTALDGVAFPTTQGWTFVSSGTVSLESYVGKKIQIGFKYTSTAEDCGTWEIKTFTLYGKGGSAVKPDAEKVADIAGFIAKANETSNTAIEGNTTAVYQNGRYLWIKDASGSLLVFGDLKTTYTNGQTIPGGIEGLYNLRYNVPQLTSPVADTFKEGTAGTAVEPELILCEDVAIDLANQYVMLKGVTIAATETANTFVMTDASGVDVQIYNQFNTGDNTVNVITGENLTLAGFVTAYKETLQIVPVLVQTASGHEVVATPAITPNGGEVMAGTEVTITCGTEGAKIYYTTDGTEPTAASTLYSAPFAIQQSCTVKAIAVKEGCDNSAVASAEFTILTVDNPVGTEAVFDWRDPASLNPAQDVPVVVEGNTAAQSVYVGGKSFVNNGVVCTIDDSGVAQASQKARLYKPTNAAGEDLPVELRTYTNTTIAFRVNDGYDITAIEFTGKKASSSQLAANVGTFDGSTWTAPAEATSKVVFNTTATTNIQSITLTLATDSGVATIEADLSTPAVYYDLQGRQVVNPAKGLYIVRQGSKTSKVIIR